MWVIAVEDGDAARAVKDGVVFAIRQQQPSDYLVAAEYINSLDADVLLVQHEYGIYGGPSGMRLLDILSRVHVPIVVTLHTVLKHANAEQREVLLDLARVAERVVVLSRSAFAILRESYGLQGERIRYIPHGLPDVPLPEPTAEKKRLGLAGHKVLLTVGLINPGKGIETIVEALPSICARHREVLYIVLGVTHPNVLVAEGERYRKALIRRVKELQLEDRLIFENVFVSDARLCQYLAAADVYVAPYISQEQIVSGTLAYALGICGVVVATRSKYAVELLSNGRGHLVAFEDAKGFATTINELLTDDGARITMRQRARAFTRPMVWSTVAAEHFAVLDSV
jgi:glycosyltransferase involved in cell wall biosynthesis